MAAGGTGFTQNPNQTEPGLFGSAFLNSPFMNYNQNTAPAPVTNTSPAGPTTGETNPPGTGPDLGGTPYTPGAGGGEGNQSGDPNAPGAGAGADPGGGGQLPGTTTATVPAVTGTVNTPPTDPAGTFAGATQPAQAPTLGASDVWNQLAFGGPTQAASDVYGATSAIGMGTTPSAQAGQQLVNQGAQNAATAGNNQNLQNAMVAATNLYGGNDPSSTALQAQQGAYMSMVGPNAGYSDAAKAAIINQGNSALNAQQASAQDQLNNAAARTGSPIGAYGAIVDVNQNIGNARAAQAAQNQVLFANEAERQKEAGAAGLGQTAATTLGREQQAYNDYLASQGQQFGQGQTAMSTANQMINDQTSRQLSGLNAAAAQNQQQVANTEAGGSGLTNLYNTNVGQQNQLYSMLASILGNKQGDTTQLGEVAQQFGLHLGS